MKSQMSSRNYYYFSMSSGDQCAVGPNGELLDASEIQFYNDVDDNVPLPPVSDEISTPAAGQATLQQYFHRSDRPRKQSSRLTDPNNAETVKHKANDAEDFPPRVRARRSSPSPACMDEDDDARDDNNDMPDLQPVSDSEDDRDGDETDQEDIDAAYEYTKSLGDVDRAAMKSRPKAELTKDIQPLFKEDEILDPDTGLRIKGHWRLLCKKDKVAQKKCFLLGNVSSRRTHISRNPGHFLVYERMCEKNDIPLHHQATPKDFFKDQDDPKQTTLDNFATKTPPFSSQGLLDYLVEMIVTEDNAFMLVDKGPFRRLLQYFCPSLKESDIPHRTKMREEILKRTEDAEERLRSKLEDIPGQVSFTFDTWTSKTGDPFLRVTGHYIDAPVDSPEDWSVKSAQLAYTPIEGNHSGDNLSRILVRTVDRYDLRDKVGWFTADNATNNDTALKALGKEIDPLKLRWDPVERRVRCMEHAVHLTAGHFISDVSPLPAKAVLAKAKKLRKKLMVANPDMDDDELDALLAGDDGEDEEDDDEGWDGDNDDADGPTPRDAVGKALALVKQIRVSPQAQAFPKKMCTETGVPVLQLLDWIRTRWASMFTFLDRLILLRAAVNRFVLLADDSAEVPNLVRKSYSNFRLSTRDWEQLIKMREVLQEPANIQQSFSSSRHPTVWRTLPLLEALAETWRNMAATEKFVDMRESINAGLDNLEKWYGKTDDTDVYFICLALDPNIKTAYAEESWNSAAFEEGMAKLEAVFDDYYIAPTADVVAVAPLQSVSTAPVQFGNSRIRAKVQARKNKDIARINPHDELRAYLRAPLQNIDNVVAWWEYPTLARIARDYLAIQGSAAPSERAFSNGSLTGTARRNRLAPEMFEALQLLKSAYRNGHVSAAADATKRVIAALDVSDDEADE
ncbi:HAT family dimerization domain-containing protein [Mycena venus]|uniref:HAT family dimerization domain-containing protein n=1 Tax=Mycena venus TaxID=2733690 RepID=A0A8H7D6X4_9AGAR|nr:HAT family dimerization domain-containing protein [Mycena venus]